jgi:hypothetical protein
MVAVRLNATAVENVQIQNQSAAGTAMNAAYAQMVFVGEEALEYATPRMGMLTA